MACKICGRQSCAESFHSLQEQEDFENGTGKFAPDDDESSESSEEE